MFGWELPPFNSGGLGVACFGLTKALAARGAKVIFVLPKRLPITAGHLELVFADDGIDYLVVDSPLSPYLSSGSYDDVYGALDAKKRQLYGANLFQEVERFAHLSRAIAARERFDVIHAHDWLTFGSGVAAKEVSGKPLVVHVHATEFDRTGGHNINEHVYGKERWGMEYADRVATVSGFTKDIVTKRYGINPDKVDVVHNGVEMNEGPRKSAGETALAFKEHGYSVVSFVGRLTIQKGADYFLRTAQRVLEVNPRVIFIVSGSGDMERQLIAEASYMGIGDKVIFTGFLRGEELAEVYRASDLYIMPSVSEPFGITPLEALMEGVPVLISKQSGVSEVLNHALKVDFWDVEEMANKILGVLAYPPLKNTLGEYGNEEARGVTWDKAAEKCLSIYGKLTSGLT